MEPQAPQAKHTKRLAGFLPHLILVSRRSREVAQGVPNARAITQTVASVGALPALLGHGEFRDGVVPSGTGPLGVYPVHRAKGIALKAGPG